MENKEFNWGEGVESRKETEEDAAPPRPREAYSYPARRGRGGTGVGLLIVALVLVWLFAGRDNQAPGGEKPEEVTLKSPYEARIDLKKLELVSAFKNSVAESKPTNVLDRRLAVTGTISQGYLYLKARVNGQALKEPDDAYVNFTAAVEPGLYEVFGGHLTAAQSLATPKSDEASELLFDLGKVSYRERFYNTEADTKIADWLTALNDYSDQRIYAFLSTVGDGTIEEMTLYYQCAEGSDCSIALK